MLKNSPTSISQKTASRQEGLQTILPGRLDICYHSIFDFFRKNRVFQPQDLLTSICEQPILQSYQAAPVEVENQRSRLKFWLGLP
jgi:hypothetical protein